MWLGESLSAWHHLELVSHRPRAPARQVGDRGWGAGLVGVRASPWAERPMPASWVLHTRCGCRRRPAVSLAASIVSTPVTNVSERSEGALLVASTATAIAAVAMIR